MTAPAPSAPRADHLAERGIAPGWTVADMRVRWPFRYGICIDVPGSRLIGVLWTDGEYEQCPETVLGATGLRVSMDELARVKYGRR